MANIVDSLFIMLSLDPAGVKQGLNQAEGIMQHGIENINKNSELKPRFNNEQFKQDLDEAKKYANSTANAILSKFTALATGYLSIQGVMGLSQNFLQGADAAAKMAKSIGVDMEALQAWTEAVKRSGGSAEGFRGSLQQLSASLSEISVKGKSRAKIFFDEIGVATVDASGKVRGAFDVMEDIATVFEKMNSQEAVGIGRKLGFDQGTIQTLQMGKKGLQELVKHQKELGVYTKRDSDIAEKYNDTMDDFRQSMQAVFSTVFRPVFAWLTKLLEKGIEFATFLQQHQPFLKAFFAMISVAIMTQLIPAFAKLAATMLANPITWIIAAMAALAIAIDDLVVWANGGNSAFGKLWASIFGTPERAKAAFKEVKNVMLGLVDVAKNVMGVFFGISKATSWVNRVTASLLQVVAAFKILSGLLTILKGKQLALNLAAKANPYILAITLVIAAIGLLYDNWDTVVAFITSSWQKISAVAASAVAYISGVWQSIVAVFQSVGDAVQAVWEGIFEWFASKFEWLTSTLAAAKNFIGGIFDGVGETVKTPVIPRGGNTANSTTTVDSNITVQNVNVQTQATDAKGIAGGIGGALKDDLGKKLVGGAQTGVKQK